MPETPPRPRDQGPDGDPSGGPWATDSPWGTPPAAAPRQADETDPIGWPALPADGPPPGASAGSAGPGASAVPAGPAAAQPPAGPGGMPPQWPPRGNPALQPRPQAPVRESAPPPIPARHVLNQETPQTAPPQGAPYRAPNRAPSPSAGYRQPSAEPPTAAQPAVPPVLPHHAATFQQPPTAPAAPHHPAAPAPPAGPVIPAQRDGAQADQQAGRPASTPPILWPTTAGADPTAGRPPIHHPSTGAPAYPPAASGGYQAPPAAPGGYQAPPARPVSPSPAGTVSPPAAYPVSTPAAAGGASGGARGGAPAGAAAGAVAAPPKRRRGRMVLLGLVALIVLALLGGGATFAALKLAGNDKDGGGGSNAAGGGGACAGKTRLRLAVAPELKAVMDTAISKVAPSSGSCPVVAVTQQQPAETLALKDQAARNFDGWVPSSTVWLKLAEADKLGFAAEGPLLARSPIVVAMPKPYAEKLGWPAKQPAWAEITAMVYGRQIPKFSMPDPLRDTTGMLATLAVYAALARTTPDPGIAQLRALTLRSRLADAAADPAKLLETMAAQPDPNQAVASVGLFPVTERALWAYDRGTHETQLVAAYQADALAEAEFPLALTPAAGGSRPSREVADKLAAWFASPEGIAALADQGLRGPTGRDATNVVPNGPGFVARYPQPFTAPKDVATIRTGLTQWAQYKRLVFQVLVLVDASGSMNEPVKDRAGNTTTKAGLLRAAGTQAAQLFGEDTSVGMWMFGTPTAQSPPYVDVLPFGPLDEPLNGQPRRKRLVDVAGAYQAMPAAGTPLFETILRANAEMEKRWRPDAVTMVVVLTDGHDRDSSYVMPKAEFLKKLNAARDPKKPLPIHSIAYGADADLSTLTELAKATGGVAAPSTDPADLASAMAKIFLAARRAQI